MELIEAKIYDTARGGHITTTVQVLPGSHMRLIERYEYFGRGPMDYEIEVCEGIDLGKPGEPIVFARGFLGSSHSEWGSRVDAEFCNYRPKTRGGKFATRPQLTYYFPIDRAIAAHVAQELA